MCARCYVKRQQIELMYSNHYTSAILTMTWSYVWIAQIIHNLIICYQAYYQNLLIRFTLTMILTM